ncbi:Hpt domain-containing protein [Massilia sp. PAMC28688]|uniref:Hpt domain-containing protein n=1 Tax=Massilia sp. PAMC28688 TaxID=2861283 RepID=UPI001C631C5B|nr:Hpt domain-containing protein [Massilia sp. PAMC28688]QYF95445.1 Hpt domain-containing protein [Massilia sp. PAMC28688]
MEPGNGAQTELRADLVTRDTIDVNDGIERVMGNRDLYARMLRRFRNDYQDGALPVRTALAAGDTLLAHRLVHTLKGAAGMIGAHRLHERAGELEQALRLDTGEFRAMLASLITEMEKVLQLLGVLLDGSPPPGMPVQLPTRALLGDTALLERLTQLLTNHDGGAIDVLEESRASLHVILGEATLQRVSDAVREFDYARALRALGETACGQGI